MKAGACFASQLQSDKTINLEKDMWLWLMLVLSDCCLILGMRPMAPTLITFWGQNRAYKFTGTEEKSLANLCTDRSPYSTIVIGYVSRFADERNKDSLPGMGFSTHCSKATDESHLSLLYCPRIANDIKYCREHDRKILIGIGGPHSPSFFDSPARAEKFAKHIWNLFLGGDEMSDLRPFGSVVLDGINFYMDGQNSQYLDTFIQTLHQLRKSDKSRRYLITTSPTCLFPDPYFGPEPNKVLGNNVHLIDQIYVRYMDKQCCIRGSSAFRNSLAKWKDFLSLPRGPEFYMAIPAAIKATSIGSCYRSPKQMVIVHNSVKWNRRFRGFVVMDNSFDLQDRDIGFTFSNDLLYYTIPESLRNSAKTIHIHVPVPVPVPVTRQPPTSTLVTTLRPISSTHPATTTELVTTTTMATPITTTEATTTPTTQAPVTTTLATTAATKPPPPPPSITPQQTLAPTQSPQISTPIQEQKTSSDDLMSINGSNKTDHGTKEESTEPVHDDDDDDDEDREEDEAEDSQEDDDGDETGNKNEANKDENEIAANIELSEEEPQKDVNEKGGHANESEDVKDENERFDEEQSKPTKPIVRLEHPTTTTTTTSLGTENGDPDTTDDDGISQPESSSIPEPVQLKERDKKNSNHKLKKLKGKIKIPKLQSHKSVLRKPVRNNYKKAGNRNVDSNSKDTEIQQNSPDMKTVLEPENRQNAKPRFTNRNDFNINVNPEYAAYKVYNPGQNVDMTNLRDAWARNVYVPNLRPTTVGYAADDDNNSSSAEETSGIEEEFIIEGTTGDLGSKIQDDKEEFSTSGSADEIEEDVVYFYPSNIKSNKINSDVNGANRQFEFRIPNVANPLGVSQSPSTLDGQMDHNHKYLKLMQLDLGKQVDKFNQDTINEQAMNPNDVDTNKTHSSEEDTDGMKLDRIHTPYGTEDSHFNNRDFQGYLSNRNLASNVNLKGNMDNLKSLMSAMQKNIDDANEAMQNKQMNDQNEEDEKERMKEKTPKNFFESVLDEDFQL